MNQERFETFITVYRRNLARIRKEQPEVYAWPESMLETISERMAMAVRNGSFSKDGPAFKATCKELGLKYTYTAIGEYLNDKVSA